MPGSAAPSHLDVSHHPGKRKPPLEEGEETHVQAMDTKDSCTNTQESIDIQKLCKHWFVEYTDIMNRAPPELPPLREINHWIPLIDKDKQYQYHLPHCPDAIKPQLIEKMKQYIEARWWIPRAVSQAVLLLCIPKKSGKLCTVVDCCQQNDNTVKDMTLFPDEDQIWMDVAQAKYHSKINLSNAYEQVWIKPEDVHKTAFTTVFGMLESNVMQQGDCNAPATFQQLVTVVFRDDVGVCIHIYLDDLFVFSYTLEDHEKDLECMFKKL